MTNVYWKTIEVWCKYPFQQEIERRYIEYSTSKKKFYKNVFLESDNQLTMIEREKLVKEKLKVKSVKLIRI